jgi:hypothetical protein
VKPDLLGPFYIEKGTTHGYFVYRKAGARQGPWYVKKVPQSFNAPVPEISNELALIHAHRKKGLQLLKQLEEERKKDKKVKKEKKLEE